MLFMQCIRLIAIPVTIQSSSRTKLSLCITTSPITLFQESLITHQAVGAAVRKVEWSAELQVILYSIGGIHGQAGHGRKPVVQWSCETRYTVTHNCAEYWQWDAKDLAVLLLEGVLVHFNVVVQHHYLRSTTAQSHVYMQTNVPVQLNRTTARSGTHNNMHP